MKKLSDFYNLISPPKVGELIEGTILNREKMALFVNLEPIGLGIVRGQEYLAIKDRLKDLKEGEKLKFKVI
jgi:phage portal protein BeeE